MKHFRALLLLSLAVLFSRQASAEILGADWHLRTGPDASGVSEDLNAIATNGVQMVAAGNHGAMVTASSFLSTVPKSTPWSVVDSKVSGDLTAVIWSAAQGQFVAVGSQYADPYDAAKVKANKRLLTITISPDGTTWTARSPASASGHLTGLVAVDANTLVAVGGSDANVGLVTFSTDKGVTWSAPKTIAGAGNFVGVVWTGSKFIAACANKLFTSTDGNAWTSTPLATTPASIAYVGAPLNTTVVIGSTSWAIKDGQAAVKITPPSTDLVLTTSGTELVGANGQDKAGTLRGEVWSSVDAGKSWQPRTPFVQSMQYNAAIRYGNDYVLVGDSGVIQHSTSSGAFLRRQDVAGVTQNLASVTSGGTRAVAVGAGGVIATASAYDSWAQAASPVTTDLNAVVWTGSQYLAVGDAGVVLTSPTGVNGTWGALLGANVTHKLRGVTFNGKSGAEALYVAVGENTSHSGVAWTSADGSAWAAHAVTFTAAGKTVTAPSLADVAWTGTKFVAAGNGYALSSADGVTWTGYPLAGLVPARVTVTASANILISGNKTFRSSDGVAWSQLGLPAGITVDWTGSTLVGVSTTGQIYYSGDNGSSWQGAFGAQNLPLTASAEIDGHYVCVGAGGVIETFATSLPWTGQASGANGVAWNGKTGAEARYVAVGWDMSWGTPNGDSNTDMQWQPYRQGDKARPFSMLNVIWSGDRFVAVGGGVWTSPDGAAWTLKVNGPGADPSVLAITQGDLAQADGTTRHRLIAFAYDNARYQTMVSLSDDKGATWTPFTDMPGHRWAVLSAAQVTNSGGGKYFLAVGWAGHFLVSIDGAASNWGEGIAAGFTNDDFTCVTDGLASAYPSRPVATTINGAVWTFDVNTLKWFKSTIWKRDAGNTWDWVKSTDGLASHSLWCVTGSNTEYIAAGNNGFILKSFNGTDWREYPPDQDGGSGTPQPINNLILAKEDVGNRLVAAAGQGIFLDSNGLIDPVQPFITLTPDKTTMSDDGDVTTVTATLGAAIHDAYHATDADRFFSLPVKAALVFQGGNSYRKRYSIAADPLVFDAATSTLTFAPGTSMLRFTITGLPDAALVNAETLLMQAQINSGDFKAVSGIASVTITDSATDTANFNPVSFTTATSTLAESVASPAPVDTLTVSVPNAPTVDLTIPLVYSGVDKSQFNGPSTVVIPATKLSATFNVQMVNNSKADGARKLTVTLGQPASGANLGSPAQHVITIIDNDTAPVFKTPPADTLVKLGDPITLSTTVTAGALDGTGTTFAGQWLKNNLAIAGKPAVISNQTGDTGYSLPIASAKLTDAAAYTFTAKSLPGNIQATVQLGVVDAPAKPVNLKSGSGTTLAVTAKGSGLSYQWKLAGVDIPGATQATLARKSTDLAEGQVYTCKVTLGTGATAPSLTSGDMVVHLTPVITPPVFGAAAVGADYSFTPAATPAASHWTITGLPSGLGYNPLTGTITGRPTKAGAYGVALSASNTAGAGSPVKATLTVGALPAGAAGTFVAIVAPDETVNSGRGSRIDLTITTSGAITGKYTDSGGASPLTGNLSGTPGSTRTAALAVAGKTLALTIDGAGGLMGGSVQSGMAGAPVKGWRQTAAPASTSGYYTCAFIGSDPSSGYGYGRLTVNAAGTVTLTGRTPDATSYTISTFIGPGRQVAAFTVLQSAASLLGEFDIGLGTAPAYANNTVTSQGLIWSPRSNVTVALTTDGGRYTAPAAGKIVMNLAAGTGNAALSFTGADLGTGTNSPDWTFTVKTPAVVSGTANAAGTAVVFTPATGEFHGQFNDLFGNGGGSRAAAFNGVLLRPGGQSAMAGKGSFNVPAEAPATDSLTGTVKVGAAP